MLSLLLALVLASPETDIRSLLNRQVDAWNRGDVEAFMTAYLDSPSLTFTGRTAVTRGYRPVLERYRLRYPTPEAMGRLQFDELEIRLLNQDAALVLGRFLLTRSQAAGGDASGRFTIVLQLTPQGWKIIHDHTS